ncbi:MAG: hypothetical protein EA378_07250 [Phycisphaerales bacterium]|nr:MAG: hypothetical protein EA378_07250 [Phycisphaerales bacterium]
MIVSRRAGRHAVRHRGAVSVLAMILLIMFGSLVAAMAVSSRGNIRTAATHVHVLRAMNAAETGMEVATRRLQQNTARFVLAHSTITSEFGRDLWEGRLDGYGSVFIAPPAPGVTEPMPPGGLAQAMINHHAMDANIDPTLGAGVPTFTSAPPGADITNTFSEENWVVTPAVRLGAGHGMDSVAYQITYAPLLDGSRIRVIVTGFDLGYDSNNKPITRTIMQDFRIAKRVDHAVISPSRIMIGKNVHVDGDLGAGFLDVARTYGDPILIKSDFFNLDPVLDAKLRDFYEAVAQYDVDNDNRLRVDHPIESLGIPDNSTDYSGDGVADNAFRDVTGDGYIDEFDIFLAHFDKDGDGRVHIETEFVDANGNIIDKDLAILIDGSDPDRNRNGVFGFNDLNGNGIFEPHLGETLKDYDPFTGRYPDQELGYFDGYIDANDRYSKVRGTIKVKAASSVWSAAQGAWQERIRGRIEPEEDKPALIFSADDEQMPAFDVATFDTTRLALRAAVNGPSFDEQVASNLGISVNDLATYVETNPPGATGSGGVPVPRYIRLDPDTTGDGLPDNHADAHFERMPFNSPRFADWYYRPVYENMVFKDVEIPMGNNGLFINCTFVGVTYIRSWQDNTHPFWTNYGSMERNAGDSFPRPVHQRQTYDTAAQPWNDLYETIRDNVDQSFQPIQQLAVNPLDKGDILNSEVGGFAPAQYNQLPDPLVLTYREGPFGQVRPASESGILRTVRVTNTKRFSNNIRFHDSLFVGSMLSDAPASYTHVRNKLQLSGSTRIHQQHPSEPENPALNPDPADMEEIRKSSMMLPHYSVDVGQFNSPPDQFVRLRGAIVAGVLDIRGNADIEGALLMTFRPVHGVAPLVDALGNAVGNPANFNIAIGYFGPDDGDMESLDPATLPTVGGVRIVGYDTDGDGLADADPFNPQPAGSTPVPFYGYGRINLRFDPSVELPDGIVLPLTIDPLPETYTEGKL